MVVTRPCHQMGGQPSIAFPSHWIDEALVSFRLLSVPTLTVVAMDRYLAAMRVTAIARCLYHLASGFCYVSAGVTSYGL